MSIMNELLEDAIALQKDGLSPGRIGLALSDRWEAENLENSEKVRRTRLKTVTLCPRSSAYFTWNGPVNPVPPKINKRNGLMLSAPETDRTPSPKAPPAAAESLMNSVLVVDVMEC